MGNLNNKLNYLAETKTLIKNALISKGIDVSDEDTFRSYVQKIIDYTGIDTSDATATASDILQGQTAYVNGEKVVGNIDTVGMDGYIDGDYINYYNNEDKILSSCTFVNNVCYKTDACLTIKNDAESFRNNIGLTPDKIKSGETVLGVEGTYEGSSSSDYNVKIVNSGLSGNVGIRDWITEINFANLDFSNINNLAGFFFVYSYFSNRFNKYKQCY